MAGDDVEHRTEVRSADRRWPQWVALTLVVAALAALALLGGGDDDDPAAPEAAADGAETLTTTAPPATIPVLGVVETDRGPLAFSTAGGSARGPATARDDAIDLAGAPVSTDGVVAALDRTGVLLVGAPGTSFERRGCCWNAIHPSTEPGHVWGRLAGQLSLVRLDGIEVEPPITLEIGDDRVLGPSTFGVVTADRAGVVRWRRPSFEPIVVELPGQRRVLDGGGEHVLAETPSARDGRLLEVWRIIDGRFWQSFEVPAGVEGDGQLSPDGSHVVVPEPDVWRIRDATTGTDVGTLPRSVTPVWAGLRRFAAVAAGDHLLVSDGTERPLEGDLGVVAEYSP